MTQSLLPLEDTIEDIYGKAMRGLGISFAELRKITELSSEELTLALTKDAPQHLLGEVAVALKLNSKRLRAIAMGTYIPATIPEIPGLHCFNTPFQDMTVNSYLVRDETTGLAAAFDTGTDCSDMLEVLKNTGSTLKYLFLTHAHTDHIFEMDRLREKTGAQVWAPEAEAIAGATPFLPGKDFSLGKLQIFTRLTRGHSVGAVTYGVKGLSRLLAFPGDAIFAGSIGGPQISYTDALDGIRKHIFTLPDETILCPGHGPLTTVGEQKAVNPFFSKSDF